MVKIEAREVINSFLILGLSINASKEEFKTKYRQMIKDVHTDIKPELGEEKFRSLNLAKTVLLAFYLERETNPYFLKDEIEEELNNNLNYGQFTNGQFRPYEYANYGKPVMPQSAKTSRNQRTNQVDIKLQREQEKIALYIRQVIFELIDALSKINFSGTTINYENLISKINNSQQAFLNNASTAINMNQIKNLWFQVYDYVDKICIAYKITVQTQSEAWAKEVNSIEQKYNEKLRQFYEDFDLFIIDFFFENNLPNSYLLDKNAIYNQVAFASQEEIKKIRNTYMMVDIVKYDFDAQFNDIIKFVKQQLMDGNWQLAN